MSLTRAEIDAWKEELRLEGQACEGFTDGVLAALVYIVLGCPPITMADLAGFEGTDLWTLAVTADIAERDGRRSTSQIGDAIAARVAG